MNEENQNPEQNQNIPTPSHAMPPVSNSPQNQGTTTNTILALVFGILSLLCCGFFTGIPAIILGYSELKGIKEGRIAESNRIMAMIGMILGIVGTILGIIGSLFYVIGFAFTDMFNDPALYNTFPTQY